MALSFQQLLNRLSFRQLQVFQAVYEYRGYRKAAEALGLTQPAVSSQIRKLEDALEQPLFEYVGRKLYCTRAGEEVARHISAMFEHIQHLQSDLHSLQGKLSGELKLSVVNTAQYAVPYLLKGFLQDYPDVSVSINVMNRSSAIEQLDSNTDDLVIMGLVPRGRALSSLPFLDNQLIPIVRADHKLASRRVCPPQRFLDARLLVRESGSGSRLALEQHCQQHRLSLQPYMELGSNDAIKHGVLAGLGVAVVPRLSVLSELRLGSVKAVNIKGFPLRRTWCLVYPSGKQPTPVIKAFLHYIQLNLKKIDELFKEIAQV